MSEFAKVFSFILAAIICLGALLYMSLAMGAPPPERGPFHLIVILQDHEGNIAIARRTNTLPTRRECEAQASSDKSEFFSSAPFLQIICHPSTLPVGKSS